MQNRGETTATFSNSLTSVLLVIVRSKLFLQPVCGIQEAVFLCSFLLLDADQPFADQPFHNLTRGVQRADLQQ